MSVNEGLAISQIDFAEYLRLKEDFPWPSPRVRNDGSAGFGIISSPIKFWSFTELLKEFRKDKYSRRVSMKVTDKFWMRTDAAKLDDSTIEEIVGLAGNRKDLLYVGFHNGSPNCEINHEIGFALNSRGFVSSMSACLAGCLMGKSYAWKGKNENFTQIYALA